MNTIQRYKEYTIRLNEFTEWSRIERIKQSCPDPNMAPWIYYTLTLRDEFSKTMKDAQDKIKALGISEDKIYPSGFVKISANSESAKKWKCSNYKCLIMDDDRPLSIKDKIWLWFKSLRNKLAKDIYGIDRTNDN